MQPKLKILPKMPSTSAGMLFVFCITPPCLMVIIKYLQLDCNILFYFAQLILLLFAAFVTIRGLVLFFVGGFCCGSLCVFCPRMCGLCEKMLGLLRLQNI